MTKKLIIILLSSMLLFGFAACKSEGKGSDTTRAGSKAESASTRCGICRFMVRWRCLFCTSDGASRLSSTSTTSRSRSFITCLVRSPGQFPICWYAESVLRFYTCTHRKKWVIILSGYTLLMAHWRRSTSCRFHPWTAARSGHAWSPAWNRRSPENGPWSG